MKYIKPATRLILGFSCLIALMPTRSVGDPAPAAMTHEEFMPLQWRFGEMLYSTSMKNSQLEAAPGWSANDESPPLSSRAAFKSAREMLKTKLNFADTEHVVWTPVRAELILVLESGDDEEFGGGGNRWYWQVTFEERARIGFNRRPARIQAIVLMDGTAVVPKVERVEEKGPRGAGRKRNKVTTQDR